MYINISSHNPTFKTTKTIHSLVTIQMIDILFILWLVVFFIFLAVSLSERSTTFGIISGIILLLLGLAVLLDGIQLRSGMTAVETGTTTDMTYVYSNAVMPFSTLAFLWGFMFVAISIYIIYANASAKAS